METTLSYSVGVCGFTSANQVFGLFFVYDLTLPIKSLAYFLCMIYTALPSLWSIFVLLLLLTTMQDKNTPKLY
jgi:hypothetical protein